MTAVQCSPSKATHYVHVIIGMTFCPHGTTCKRDDCARTYGTETREVDAYFSGRPGTAERRAMVPDGWRILASTTRPTGRKATASAE
jgi:hypothetical protein